MSTTQIISASADTNEAQTVPGTGALSTAEYIAVEDQYAAKSLSSLPVVLTRGQGAHLWDIDGKKYIDFLSAFSVVNQGHCHPRLVKVMVEQCQKLTLTSRAYHNEHYPLLCKKLCDLLNFDMAFPMNSGSEAVDLAIKVVRKWGYVVKGIEPDQALVVTISGNYHGKSIGPLSASNNPKIRNGYGPFTPGIGTTVNGRVIGFSNIEDLQYAFEVAGDRIAAVIVECVQGYAGCIPTQPGYIKAAYDLCKKNNSLFVCDEIQSGFGRTGYLMAYQNEGVHPDLVILGKALTGGMYSIGMVVGSKDVLGQMRPGEHSSTFSGNPLACAIAVEAIDVLVDEKLSQRSLELGTRMIKRLSDIKSPHTTVKVTGRGLFCAFNIDESHPSGKVTAARLTSLMRKRGVLAHSVENRVRIAPPLVIEEKDLWDAVDIVEKSLNDLVEAPEDLVLD